MTRRRVEPLVWLMFSAGGVLAAVFLPILVLLFGLAFPLGWLDPPDHEHLLAVISHPVTLVVLLGLFVLMLVHSAHRFRFTLYDGLQVKAKRTVGVLCYGAAIVGSVATLAVLWAAAQEL
jgi:fumarate reductase subunit D